MITLTHKQKKNKTNNPLLYRVKTLSEGTYNVQIYNVFYLFLGISHTKPLSLSPTHACKLIYVS